MIMMVMIVVMMVVMVMIIGVFITIVDAGVVCSSCCQVANINSVLI